MDNLDDSENNAKISDSAYSNSCSNSQSRRSHSSKYSGSNSSGSSGYGGKPSTSGYSRSLRHPSENRSKDKEVKKIKKVKQELQSVETKKGNQWPLAPVFQSPNNDSKDVSRSPPTVLVQLEKGPENMEIAIPDRSSGKNVSDSCSTPSPLADYVMCRRNSTTHCLDGFSCVISMKDGVVMYTAPSLTTTLGFPKDMWIGRSFIDFVHPRDRSTFASQITSVLAVPKNVNHVEAKAPVLGDAVCTMVCRIRRYGDLASGFGIRDRVVNFMPFLLKFYFKNITEEEGQVTYLVIQASPFFSAFKVPNEVLAAPKPFVIRHSPNGSLQYVDPESVPYLGYLPQDIVDKDALQLYHPGDLVYLRRVYEAIVKEGVVSRSKAYRMLTQNGQYLKVETEWSSFTNPWSKKLEFVIGKHYVIEGPSNPDVFQAPQIDSTLKLSDEDKAKAQALRKNIMRIMNEVLTKPAEVAKQQMSKRCQNLASFMETLIEDTPKTDEDLRLEMEYMDHNCFERDSVLLGGISPHHDCNDSKSSAQTPISYNQLNCNETLQRYFDSHEPYEDYNFAVNDVNSDAKSSIIADSDNISVDCCSSDYIERTRLIDSSAMTTTSCNQANDYYQIRLTESLLNKHNADMEKELARIYRENRSSIKSERERTLNETRQKKKEHLARCSASYQPTITGASTSESQPHGVKRGSKQAEEIGVGAYKYRCSSPRLRRKESFNTPNLDSSGLNTSNIGGAHYQPCSSAAVSFVNTNTHHHTTPPGLLLVPCMMFGQSVYGPPFVYSSIDPQVYAMQHNFISPNIQNMQSLELSRRNYEEACKHMSVRIGEVGFPVFVNTGREKTGEPQPSKPEQTVNATDWADASASRGHSNIKLRRGNSEATHDKTDGESSYSSFYSSFFKTESGSAEDSDVRNTNKDDNSRWKKKRRAGDAMSMQSSESYPDKLHPRKQTKMEQVSLTSEIIYKYQIMSKNIDEVLSRDKETLKRLEQPLLVNDQLNQLYLDMQLEGVAARLTLEEGITSSSSSGEENTSVSNKVRRRKREYSKLTMIYEEDAPLPSPPSPPEDSFST